MVRGTENPLEQLDRQVGVVGRRPVLYALALGLLVVAGVVWAGVAEIRQEVTLGGTYLPSAQVVPVAIEEQGIVTAVSVEEGDAVSVGQPVGTISGPLGPVEVTAPIDGEVLQVIARPGIATSSGTPIMLLVPDRDDVVVTYIPIDLLEVIAAGDRARLRFGTSDALDGGRGSVDGTVVSVDDLPAPPLQLLVDAMGNETVAGVLSLGGGPVVRVVVEPDRADTPSGMAWNGGDGPDRRLPFSTVVELRFVVGSESLLSKAF